MARSASLTVSTSATRLALGFVAGFLATLTFHQIGIWALHAVGFIPFTAWGTAPKPPFGVPSVISLSFWGGVWGILFVLILISGAGTGVCCTSPARSRYCHVVVPSCGVPAIRIGFAPARGTIVRSACCA